MSNYSHGGGDRNYSGGGYGGRGNDGGRDNYRGNSYDNDQSRKRGRDDYDQDFQRGGRGGSHGAYSTQGYRDSGGGGGYGGGGGGGYNQQYQSQSREQQYPRGGGGGDYGGGGNRGPSFNNQGNYISYGGGGRGDGGGGGGYPPQQQQQQPYGGSGGSGRGDFGGRGGGRGGGRDGGRFDSGGRGGRGGPGGRGSHMGQQPDLLSKIQSSPDCGDEAALRVIAPPVGERDRDPQLESTDPFHPQASEWRVGLTAGLALTTDDHKVRANYLKVGTGRLPPTIYHYAVSLFRYSRDGTVTDEDLAKGTDKCTNLTIMDALRTMYAGEWRTDAASKRTIGMTYDGGAGLYTSLPLPCIPNLRPDQNAKFTTDVLWPGSKTAKFCVVLMFVAFITHPSSAVAAATGGSAMQVEGTDMTGPDWGDACYKKSIQALDIALFSFARWKEAEDNAPWIVNGAKVFRTNGTAFPLTAAFTGMLGYHASLKACVSGLVLVADISVTAFLKGGPLMEVMAWTGGLRDKQALISDAQNGRLNAQVVGRMEAVLKGCKLKAIHLGHHKKFRSFGPAANSVESSFVVDESSGQKITVADYYAAKVQEGDPVYVKHLGATNGLKHPALPTVNVGSRKRPVLMPVELLHVTQGQTRSRCMTGEISGKIIKYAAMLPNDRVRNITDGASDGGLLKALRDDEDVRAFGLDQMSGELMRIHSTVLCPAKLQYGNRLVEPKLGGTWNLAGNIRFAHPAPPDADNCYHYQVLVVYSGRNEPSESDYAKPVSDFQRSLEAESRIVGIPMHCGGAKPRLCRAGSPSDLTAVLTEMKYEGVRIVLVVQVQDCYNAVKYAADSLSLPTQCLQWKNIAKMPRGYSTNVLLKINYKLGGVAHTLAARGRAPTDGPEVFQSPPQSLSWLFDDLCMVVGVDVTHNKMGESGPSVAAVVASMDGMLGQYSCFISTCRDGEEPVATLETALFELLKTFRARHGDRMPKRIIVYRDGVADNQFQDVHDKEIPAFKNAIMLHGYPAESVPMCVTVCQKRHHTRLVYENAKTGDFENPCVGLCTDGHTGRADRSGEALDSLASPGAVEFYLNSHLAVLGTSKPCRYSLIFDEIGIKLAELELLTYWSTHLYCRCTRSVSYATPAYYAHWAARRGKALLSAGASDADLPRLSQQWLNGNVANSMYFI